LLNIDSERFRKNLLCLFMVQSLSYGLDGEKLNKTEVIKYWGRIKDQLDPARRDYLNFLLWGNQS